MRIDITSRTQPVTAALQQRIEQQLGKLERFDVDLIHPKVVIDRDGNAVVMEATIGLPHGELVAKARHNDGYVALSDMVQKLQRQMKTYLHKPQAQRGQKPIVSGALDAV
ncbi:ribosome hibernation-promoting factor, HPF/YfiA family [Gallaecimonas sp. GXIMD1310]|uniref:ribosome hibernation-promoting factor, HPF/YfiA family n=1 Tax=Gallaecimonas sp. GXIMD1310 TaxID=3131926 RepID=UPI00324710BC